MGSKAGARRIFIGLILVALGLVFTLVLPFGGAIVFAMVLSGALLPLHRRPTKNLGGRPHSSAVLSCFGVFLLVLLPLAGLGSYAFAEVFNGVKFVTETARSDGMSSLIARHPEALQGAAR
jgi:predicted PurR-regulated permease PerM